MKTFRPKRSFLHPVILLILVGAAVQSLTWAGWLEKPETIYTDLWHQLAGLRYTPEHVVIVSLDDQTLAAHPDEPLVSWTPHFARVVQVLRQVGARIIGLDYLYYVSIEDWLKKLDLPQHHQGLKYDETFKRQLASGQVIMAANLGIDQQQKSKFTLPLPNYFASLPRGVYDVGLVNFYTEGDGVVRHYVPAMADADGQVMLTFAKLLAARASGQDPVEVIRRLRHDPALKNWSTGDSTATNLKALPVIGFAGPPDTFPRLSFGRFLRPDAEQDPEIRKLKDKVVIIAYEPSALQDIHYTPYSLSLGPWQGSDMSGPELHANIVETLLTGKFPRPVPGYLRAFYLIAALLVGGGLFFRLPSWRGLAAVGLLCLLVAAFAYLLFRHHWLLPTANVQLAMVLSYVGILGLRLTGEERERARIRKIFGRYVTDEVVDKLLASGRLPDLGGDSFQVTVLFTDIRNFTTISESLGPRAVVEMLNTYLAQACEPILTQGGTVDKFIGDAVMAVFGSPVLYPDHARRALRAALGLAQKAQAFRAWMQQRFADQELPDFAIGIGIHTGEAIVGNIGSPKRLEFTAIGDTVNTASRLEGLTKELGWTIVASQSTIEAAPGVVTGGQATRVVKGRKEPIQVFEVLGLEET
ncbi:MAG: adenylate/guanylate cyclase domain-containing protein [Desulfobaccales bacterium]